MLKIIEFFSGIGAYHQALKELDIEHEVVGISEIDKDAIKAYQILHGKTKVLGDVKKIKKTPEADLWCYSFPCTDISIAGRMRGMDRDSKTSSSLLWEIERLLLACDHLPKYLILENVPTLVGKTYIEHFKEWMKFLEGLGYKNYYQVLNAKDYGVAQNRKRLFMVSIIGDEPYVFPKKMKSTRKLADYLDEDVDDKYFVSPENFLYYTDMKDRNGFVRGTRFRPHRSNDKYAHTLTTGSGNSPFDNFILVPEATKAGLKKAKVGDGIYINRPHQKRGVVQIDSIPTLKTSAADIGVVVENEDNLVAIRRLTPRECFRLMGWSSYDFMRLDGKISETGLYRLAGNSVVVSVLKAIFKVLFGVQDEE
jgi:DNA (cytosine-5)-methyltransferase 1